MRVKCYWNLNKAKQGEYVFSIVNLADGKVDGYASDIAILNAKFHVGTKARLKIAGGEKKSVHAWVTGQRVSFQGLYPQELLARKLEIKSLDELSEATYNPKRDEWFTDVHTGEKLGTTSPLVVLKAINKRGVVFYKG
jgi:hypothetical protein